MTTETITTTDEGQNGNNKPNYYAKVRHGFGKKASYERIGAAWRTEDGSIYVKLAGTQVAYQADELRVRPCQRRCGACRPAVVEADRRDSRIRPER